MGIIFKVFRERTNIVIWDLDPVFIYLPDFLGGREIRYYGLLYAVALMGGFYFWQWQILRSKRTQEQADRILGMGVAAVIVGARVGHCLFYSPEYYLSNPFEIIKVWEGGLASHGSTIALIMILIYYAKTESMTIREVFDRFSVSVAWAASIIRLGNLMNSEIVGRTTDVSWGFKFPFHDRVSLNKCICEGQNVADTCISTIKGCADLTLVPTRHPSQIYEFIMGMIVFTVLLLVDRKYGENRPLGLMGGLVLLLYFTGRFIVEFFKQQQVFDGNLDMGHYLSIPFALIGLAMVLYALKYPNNNKQASTNP